MDKFEIWGPDENGDRGNLADRVGDVPKVEDTIDVGDRTRKLRTVQDHHENGGSTTKRVWVSQFEGGGPMPVTSE